MNMSTNPTGLVLVGLLFICIFLGLVSAEQQSDVQDQLNKFQDRSLYSLHREGSQDLGVLTVGEDEIYFPWYRSPQSVRPTIPKEEILLDNTNSTAKVEDLLAINSQKQRDLIHRDSQNGDPDNPGLANSLDIGVNGIGGSDTDAVFAGNEGGGVGGRGPDDDAVRYAGNYLSVDVHDITVSAVNSIKGGSAVATSNIIIEPVQILVCPSEVDEKLI
jgi:hypothetical protein